MPPVEVALASLIVDEREVRDVEGVSDRCIGDCSAGDRMKYESCPSLTLLVVRDDALSVKL